MRLGRRLSTGIAEDPPLPVPVEAPVVAEVGEAPAPQHAAVPEPRPARTPDPAVSGS